MDNLIHLPDYAFLPTRTLSIGSANGHFEDQSVPDVSFASLIKTHLVTAGEYEEYFYDLKAQNQTWIGMGADPRTREVIALYRGASNQEVRAEMKKIRSNTAYRACRDQTLLEGAFRVFRVTPPFYSNKPEDPAICMDWWMAQAYCNYQQWTDGKGRTVQGRLPTEAEWKRAAWGPEDRETGLWHRIWKAMRGRTNSIHVSENKSEWCLDRGSEPDSRVVRYAYYRDEYGTGNFFSSLGFRVVFPVIQELPASLNA